MVENEKGVGGFQKDDVPLPQGRMVSGASAGNGA